ncbi:MAG: hypothetical protein ACTSO7_07685 [Candidatus Heimdallarchaeota archaeon]
MKTITKIAIGLSLIALFVLPITTQFTAAESDKIGVKDGVDAISINTDFITMKIIEGKPHFVWWNGNQSTADEKYNVQFTTLQEYFGDDESLDTRGELLGGLSYNLVTSEWSYEILEEDHHVQVTLSLGLANDAELQFIVHIYTEDQPIMGTDQTVEALSEVKFDIVIDNWTFTPGAQGIALKSQILESQQRHQVRIREGSDAENGNRTRSMLFESKKHKNAVVAYLEWAEFADVYDGASKEDTIEVGQSNLDEGYVGEGSGVDDPGMVHLWFTYPNYNDSYTLVHDPSIGVYPDAFNLPLYVAPIIGGLVATVIVVGIVRKRK